MSFADGRLVVGGRRLGISQALAGLALMGVDRQALNEARHPNISGNPLARHGWSEERVELMSDGAGA